MIARFLAMSEALTGIAPLEPKLAQEYLQRARGSAVGDHLDALLAEYEAILAKGGDIDAAIQSRIMTSDRLRSVAAVVILLWYLGDYGEGGPADHYFQGKFWQVIRAHPPGLSGGYFGHWSYPPDN